MAHRSAGHPVGDNRPGGPYDIVGVMGIGLKMRGVLAIRLALCQIFGTLAGISTGAALSPIWHPGPYGSVFGSFWLDFSYVLLFGLAFGIPVYCAALLILHNATTSILKYPFIWCLVIPTALFVVALLAFPPEKEGGIIWIALIPLSAMFAGAAFCVWLRQRPLTSAS
jgi:Sec-independent protein secretion pathway component TatC